VIGSILIVTVYSRTGQGLNPGTSALYLRVCFALKVPLGAFICCSMTTLAISVTHIFYLGYVL